MTELGVGFLVTQAPDGAGCRCETFSLLTLPQPVHMMLSMSHNVQPRDMAPTAGGTCEVILLACDEVLSPFNGEGN